MPHKHFHSCISVHTQPASSSLYASNILFGPVISTPSNFEACKPSHVALPKMVMRLSLCRIKYLLKHVLYFFLIVFNAAGYFLSWYNLSTEGNPKMTMLTYFSREGQEQQLPLTACWLWSSIQHQLLHSSMSAVHKGVTQTKGLGQKEGFLSCDAVVAEARVSLHYWIDGAMFSPDQGWPD